MRGLVVSNFHTAGMWTGQAKKIQAEVIAAKGEAAVEAAAGIIAQGITLLTTPLF